MISLFILRLHMKQKKENCFAQTSLRVCCKHINYLKLTWPCISQSLLMKTKGWGKMSGFKPVSSHSLSALSPSRTPWPHSGCNSLVGLLWMFWMCSGSISHFAFTVSPSPSGVDAAHQYIHMYGSRLISANLTHLHSPPFCQERQLSYQVLFENNFCIL